MYEVAMTYLNQLLNGKIESMEFVQNHSLSLYVNGQIVDTNMNTTITVCACWMQEIARIYSHIVKIEMNNVDRVALRRR